MLRFRTPLLAGLLALAGAATIAVPVASAHEFHLETAPAVLQGESAFGPSIFENSVNEKKVECAEGKSTVQGTVEKSVVPSIRVHPFYQNCLVSEFGIVVQIITQGCDFVLQGKTSEAGHGQVAIECQVGKQIELKVESFCTAKVKSQTAAGGVGYVDSGTGSARQVRVNFTASGLSYELSNSFPCSLYFGNGKDLTLTGAFTVKGYEDIEGNRGNRLGSGSHKRVEPARRL
jgi:hypothetical protein